MLGKTGAIESEISEDPRPKVRDVLFSNLESSRDENNDW